MPYPHDRRPTSDPSTASEQRVPNARITFELDQHTAAALAGKIAPHWGTVAGEWTPGNGLLTPQLFRLPLALLDEEPPSTCRHADYPGSLASDRHWWPAMDEHIVCTDPCLYGPSGLWFGLRHVVTTGIIPLNCDACAQPIEDRLLHLQYPLDTLTLHALVCAGCIEAAAAPEILP